MGQSQVSVLERCPYKRGHYDDITFMTPLMTQLTLIFKLHLKLSIHSTETLFFSSIQRCTSELQTNYRLILF